jgi:N-methylhydantoinase A
MAEAPLLFERSQALLSPLSVLAGGDLDRAIQRLEIAVIEAFAAEGIEAGGVRLVPEVSARYDGQSHEIRYPYRLGRVAEDFHAAHEIRNGFRDEQSAIEVVAVHVAGYAEEEAAAPGAAETRNNPNKNSSVSPTGIPNTNQTAQSSPAPISPIGQSAAGPLFRREDLPRGVTLAGPAVVGEYSGTTWVPPGWRLLALINGDLRLECTANGPE